jgi:hypothetical protein
VGSGCSPVGQKSSPVDGGHDGGGLAASVSLLGHHGEALHSRCRGLPGENIILLDVRQRCLGVIAFLKASFVESRR